MYIFSTKIFKILCFIKPMKFLKRKINYEYSVTVSRGGYDYQEVNYDEVEKVFIYPQFDIGAGVSFD